MFGFLKYTEGAIPGKATKKKKTEDEKKEKSKLYETNRPARKLNKKWQENRPWLKFENDTMTCSVCLDYYINTNKPGSSGLQRVRGQNTFITGCTNRKISAVLDHEISNAHEKAILSMHSKTVTNEEKITSNAGKALLSLKHAEREKLRILFVNTHAIIKNNRPLRDFPWLCKLDILKGLDLGDMYQNQKAALDFMTAIGQASSDKTVKLINSTNFFAFMMDGSTDISGDEQEVLYVRTSVDDKVVEQYLGIGSPKSTSSQDLKEFAVNMFDSCGLDKGKLVAMGSDGASNMVGRRSGLATLLRQEVNDEIINVHCFAHRLELAFRDVLKKEKKYDKLMTLLIGLYYFYMKSYKSKKGLLDTMKALNVDGILPAKVTGTRWLPHLTRAIICLIRNFPAYEAHLCSLSHTNPKAEGLVKIMLSKDVVCFVLFLKEALKPLQKLSLQLQKPESTLADSIHWVEATIELTHECKMIMRDSDEVKAVLDSGTYKSIKLRGNTPTMSYVNPLIDGFIEAMKTRFELNESEATVMNATKILHLKNWPKIESESDLKGYAVDEVTVVANHFSKTLKNVNPTCTTEEALDELKLMKKVLYKRYKERLHTLSWSDVYDKDFPMMMLVIDVLNCIPPTSVTCETTFSQMKLIKTSRRTRLRPSTLNNLLLVKLQSPEIGGFNPDSSIDKWMASSLKPRRVTYKRKQKQIEQPCNKVILIDNMEQDLNETVDADDVAVNSDDDAVTNDVTVVDDVAVADAGAVDVDERDITADHYGDIMTQMDDIMTDDNPDIEQLDIDQLNHIYSKEDDDVDDYCVGFCDEAENWMSLFSFTRD